MSKRGANLWSYWYENGGHGCDRLRDAIAAAILELEPSRARRRRRAVGARRKRQVLRIIPNLPDADPVADGFTHCPYCGEKLGEVAMRKPPARKPIVPEFLPEEIE